MSVYTVSVADVLDYLGLNSPGSTSSYSAATVGSNIIAAQEFLEQETSRWFVDRPSATYTTTSMIRARVPIPGFRTFSSVTFGGSALVQDQSFWPIPDAQQTGIFTALQFRAWRADPSDRPWWYADSHWWDKALDSPFYPGNYGGGYAWTSMPNDLIVVGDGGYAAGSEPFAFRHAVKIMAGFYTVRRASILADVAITPQGGVLNYSSTPPEVSNFIRSYRSGQQAVSAG